MLPELPAAGPALPPMALWNLRLGEVTFHMPKDPPPSVEARRGEVVLWRKQVGVVDQGCLVP